MDSKRLAEIADVMEDRGLTRVRVEEPDGTAVELERASAAQPVAAPMPMPSESIILGVGAVTKTPVWSDEVEAFIPISKANIVATGDHRVVDGADIGRLLKRVAELLQRPEYL